MSLRNTMPKRRGLGFLGSVIAAGVAFAGIAGAGPLTFSDIDGPITLSCTGLTMQVTATGNGQFAPGREVDGTRVFIPVIFGAASTTYIGPDGTILVGDNFNQATRGNSTQDPDGLLYCQYTATWAGGDGWTTTILGSVIGRVPPGQW